MRISRLPYLVDTFRSRRRLERIARGECPDRQIRFMKLGDTLLRYRLHGRSDRPCLVLSADPPTVLECYDQLIELLSDDFQIVVFEPPGFGYSLPPPRFEFSMTEYSEIVETFLERLGVGPYLLGLPCVFGFVAIELGKRRPDLISHVIMIQQPSWQGALDWRAGCDPYKLLRSPVIGQLGLQLAKRHAVGMWFSSVVANTQSAQRLTARAHRSLDDGGCFCLASIFQRYFDVEPSLSGIEQPVLTVWGLRDRSHGRRESTRAAGFGQGRVVEHVFADRGHYPELEDPARFARVLLEFVSTAR